MSPLSQRGYIRPVLVNFHPSPPLFSRPKSGHLVPSLGRAVSPRNEFCYPLYSLSCYFLGRTNELSLSFFVPTKNWSPSHFPFESLFHPVMRSRKLPFPVPGGLFYGWYWFALFPRLAHLFLTRTPHDSSPVRIEYSHESGSKDGHQPPRVPLLSLTHRTLGKMILFCSPPLSEQDPPRCLSPRTVRLQAAVKQFNMTRLRDSLSSFFYPKRIRAGVQHSHPIRHFSAGDLIYMLCLRPPSKAVISRLTPSSLHYIVALEKFTRTLLCVIPLARSATMSCALPLPRPEFSPLFFHSVFRKSYDF